MDVVVVVLTYFLTIYFSIPRPVSRPDVIKGD